MSQFTALLAVALMTGIWFATQWHVNGQRPAFRVTVKIAARSMGATVAVGVIVQLHEVIDGYLR